MVFHNKLTELRKKSIESSSKDDDFVPVIEKSIKSPSFLHKDHSVEHTIVTTNEVVENERFKKKSVLYNALEADKGFLNHKKRVKLKTISALILGTVSYVSLLFLGIGIFDIHPVVTTILVLLYPVICSIFFVIIASKKYVYFFILAQFLVSIVFLLVFNQLTIINCILFFVLQILVYQGYVEVERQQLSSRLFSILMVTKSSVKILSSFAIAIVSISFFVNASKVGATTIVEDKIFSNTFFKSTVLNANGDSIWSKGLNLFGASSYDDFLAKLVKDEKPTVKNYIIKEDIGAVSETNVLTQTELTKINSLNRFNPEKIDAERLVASQNKIQTIFNENYSTTPLGLNDEISKEDYSQLLIKKLSKSLSAKSSTTSSELSSVTNTFNKLDIVGSDQVPVLGLSLLLFFVLYFLRSIIETILGLVTNLTNISLRGIIWWMLIKLKFVKIEVEQLESEIVTI
jgi:hypothetical protein